MDCARQWGPALPRSFGISSSRRPPRRRGCGAFGYAKHNRGVEHAQQGGYGPHRYGGGCGTTITGAAASREQIVDGFGKVFVCPYRYASTFVHNPQRVQPPTSAVSV